MKENFFWKFLYLHLYNWINSLKSRTFFAPLGILRLLEKIMVMDILHFKETYRAFFI